MRQGGGRGRGEGGGTGAKIRWSGRLLWLQSRESAETEKEWDRRVRLEARYTTRCGANQAGTGWRGAMQGGG